MFWFSLLPRFNCRWRFGLSFLVGGGDALAEAFGIPLEHRRVMDQSVYGCDGHRRVGGYRAQRCRDGKRAGDPDG